MHLGMITETSNDLNGSSFNFGAIIYHQRCASLVRLNARLRGPGYKV
jgi:hypothetical protein